MTPREELLQLVQSLPERALPDALATLQELQVWPPTAPEAEALDEAFARMQTLMQARLKDIQERRPEGGGIGGEAMDPEGKRRGRWSFGYPDGEYTAHETTTVFENHEVTLVERIRMDEAANKLLFVIEVTGQDGTKGRQEYSFDIMPG